MNLQVAGSDVPADGVDHRGPGSRTRVDRDGVVIGAVADERQASVASCPALRLGEVVRALGTATFARVLDVDLEPVQARVDRHGVRNDFRHATAEVVERPYPFEVDLFGRRGACRVAEAGVAALDAID